MSGQAGSSEDGARTRAFLFPGQGSQQVGMGKALAEAFPVARAVFDEADAALGFALSRLCFEGPEAELTLTANAQPAILTTSIAALRVLESETDLRAGVVAGHSLGEYSALVAAGSLRLADAVRIVNLRGKFMQEAVAPGVGAMAAILGLVARRRRGGVRRGDDWRRRDRQRRELQRRGPGGHRRAQGARSSAPARPPRRAARSGRCRWR